MSCCCCPHLNPIAGTAVPSGNPPNSSSGSHGIVPPTSRTWPLSLVPGLLTRFGEGDHHDVVRAALEFVHLLPVLGEGVDHRDAVHRAPGLAHVGLCCGHPGGDRGVHRGRAGGGGLHGATIMGPQPAMGSSQSKETAAAGTQYWALGVLAQTPLAFQGLLCGVPRGEKACVLPGASLGFWDGRREL